MNAIASVLDNKINTLKVVIFCIVIALPLLSMPFMDKNHDSILKTENRLAASWPSLVTLRQDFTKFTREANQYLNDNLIFRHQLLKYYAKLNYKLLNRTTGGKAIIGNKGWMYLSYPSVLENVRGVSPLTPQEAQQWAAQALLIKETVEQYGGEFLIVIVPDKAQVYPEYLPDNIIHQPTQRRANQLSDALKKAQINYIDLLPSLLLAKKTNDSLIYSKTDSHWSFVGALNGYQATIKKLNTAGQTLPIVQVSQFRKVIKNNFVGDLANSLNLENLFSEKLTILQPIDKKEDNKKTVHRDKSLLLLADSFTGNQLTHFQYSFKDVTCIHHDWGEINLDTIKQHKADIVVLQMIERGLSFSLSVSSDQKTPCFN